MYLKDNKIFSDAGKYLVSGNSVGFELPSDSEDVKELDVILNDMELRNTTNGIVNAHCTGGIISFLVKPCDGSAYDCATLKAEVVRIRYSSEEQIAVLTSGDDMEKQYLTDWCGFAADVANRVMLLTGNTDTSPLEEAKRSKINAIKRYDSSSAVNEFYYNGNPYWIDKQTRVGLVNSTQMEMQAGRETTTLILGNVVLDLPCATVLQMLAALEVYAKDCYNVTARHLIMVGALDDVDNIASYDYTTGYPEKLRF